MIRLTDHLYMTIAVMLTGTLNHKPAKQAKKLSYQLLESKRIEIGLDMRNLSSGFVNNKLADQPAHLCSLISAFVIR